MKHHGAKHYFEQEAGAPAPIMVTVTRRLQFSEADPLQIAWHGNFARFFEAAYSELSHRCGFDNTSLEEKNIAALFYNEQFDYRIPLRCDKVFHTSAALIWCEKPQLNIEYTIQLVDGRIATTGCSTQLFIDLHTFTPLWYIPPFWEDFLERWRNGKFLYE